MSDDQYWDEFYSRSKKVSRLSHPSQFAAFVLGEMGDVSNLLEFGCGTGRDAFFFAEFGKQVFAYDGSHAVIERNLAKSQDVENKPAFQEFDIEGDFAKTHSEFDGEKCIYARFFIHALNDDQVGQFFDLCKTLLNPGEKLYLEYRTERDSDGVRVTREHYRNYLKSSHVTAELTERGFATEYAVEGVGFAKWGEDDAFVARHIMVRTDG